MGLETVLINGISLPWEASEDEAVREARRRLRGVHLLSDDTSFFIYKRSVDARHRGDIRFVYSVAARGSFSALALEKHRAAFPVLHAEMPEIRFGSRPLSARPIVVGSGPCGLFAALLLAENGYAPLLLERGGPVEERVEKVATFREKRLLDPDTNIQFGAGGAGTFSDGKLVTRIGDGLCGYVLERFVSFGAPKEITVLAKPHIGTDILRHVVENMLARIVALGGEVLYHTPLTDITAPLGHVRAVKAGGEEMDAGVLLLATGHSARDTYEMWLSHGFAAEAKPFSVGVRIEHRQEDIDRALYGDAAGAPGLGHAEYALSHDTKNRGVYTFCMCPGGEVVAAASEKGGVVVNGMSCHARDGRNANSAVVASIFKEDYGGTPRGAIALQRQIEQAAFRAGGGDYAAPVCRVGDFLSGCLRGDFGRVTPTYMDGKGVHFALPENYLPPFVADALRGALPAFGKKMAGFDSPDAVLTGAETRTSAPVRLLRDETRRALGFDNLYPCGEGAGYAGGITSAAIDGIRTALAVMAEYAPPARGFVGGILKTERGGRNDAEKGTTD